MALTLFELDPGHLLRADLPLYGRLIDDFIGLDRRSSQGRWLVGAVLRFARDEEVYKDHGLPSFADWVRQRRGFQLEQAERYIQITALPFDLLKGLEADIHRLVTVRSKPEVFWPPLLTAAGEGIDEIRLNLAARAGARHLREHHDEAAACEEVLAVARGKKADVPDRPVPTPGDLGNQMLRALRGKRVAGALQQLLEQKKDGRILRGKWLNDLWSEFQQLNQQVAAVCEKDGASHRPAAPATDPPPAPKNTEFPARENRLFPKENNDLSEKFLPPPCPDPCPLCQGRSKDGRLHHQPGCALLPEGRRCTTCGATVNGEGVLVHGGHCLFSVIHDDRHPHSWRCSLDPLCRFYQGSPGGGPFKLPLEPGCPTDRPWLYRSVSAPAEAAGPAAPA